MTDIPQTVVEKAAEALDDGLHRLHGIVSSCDHHEEARTVLAAAWPDVRRQVADEGLDPGDWEVSIVIPDAATESERDELLEKIADALFAFQPQGKWDPFMSAREVGGDRG